MSIKLQGFPDYRATRIDWLDTRPSHWLDSRIKLHLREKEARKGNADLPLLSLTRQRGLITHASATSKISSAEDLSHYKVCAPGDLVMNRMQAWSGMFAASTLTGIVSPDYSVFEVTNGNAEFFENLFRSPRLVEQFALASKGIGTGFNRLYTPEFGAIRIPVPPCEEQEAIVRFIHHLDQRANRFITAKRKLIDLLNEQKQAVLIAAFRSSQLINSASALWQIGHFARVGNGSTPSRSRPEYWAIDPESGYPWLNSSSVNQGIIRMSNQFVTKTALSECHLPKVQPGSVLVAITGEGKTRGTAAILTIDATINQHIAYISPRRDLISTEYLHLALTAAYQELREVSEASGSTKAALTCHDLKRFKITLPERVDQDRVVAQVHREIENAVDAINRTQSEIDLIREYRTRLVSDVVTGQLDVRHLDLPDVDEQPVDLTGEIDEGDDIDELAGDDLAEAAV